MLDDVQTLEFYYDSEEDEPKEDPNTIRDRLEETADKHGIEYDVNDVAEMSDEEWSDRHQTLVNSIKSEREYHVGNRIFTSETFGRLRPVLVIRYEESDGIDIYPHQNDEVSDLPIRIQDFLDDVDADTTSDRGDYIQLQETEQDEEGIHQSDTDATDHDTASSEPLLTRIKQLVT